MSFSGFFAEPQVTSAPRRPVRAFVLAKAQVAEGASKRTAPLAFVLPGNPPCLLSTLVRYVG